MSNLNTVESFGAVDADSDELLLQSFEDHEAFDAIRRFQRFLIVGRKGSGKTAIFKHMLKRDQGPEYFCFGHTFSDYPWYLHDQQEKVGVPDSDKFTHSWKYLILLTASKIVLNSDQSLPHDDQSLEDMAKVESFIMDTYGTKDPDVTQIFTPSKRLKLKPHFEFDAKLLKAGISPEDVPMEELPSIIPEVRDPANRLWPTARTPFPTVAGPALTYESAHGDNHC